MAYKPNYATGDLIDVTIWQELVNEQFIFANQLLETMHQLESLPQQKDNSAIYQTQVQVSGGLQYYNGSAWANTSLTADITGLLLEMVLQVEELQEMSHSM